MPDDHIIIEGAWQNNLKGINLRLPLNKLIVITGVSGSGKSSLAFDTIYSEGQRRYVETFSPYTRQFLERMDKPRVDRIEGIPPAIAIDQTNPVRTSRSTVGTMTELNDHLKLLFSRAARLYCKGCGKQVRRDSPESIWRQLQERADPGINHGNGDTPIPAETRLLITFPVSIPRNFSEEEVVELLKKEGYYRIHRKQGKILEVIQDRVKFSEKNRSRIIEDLEAAFIYGQGRLAIYPLDEEMKALSPLRGSTDLHCPECDLHYQDPVPNNFSFNSPIGACETCRGFGRVIGIDYTLVVPDEKKTLAQGAIRPWQTESYRECQEDLIDFALRRGVPITVPWRKLSNGQKEWVIQGEGRWEDGKWYGVKRFFDWLETKSYKMHIRVLLSKYRAYQICPSCRGARLKPDALLWRIGSGRGLNIHEVMCLPIDQCWKFFKNLKLPKPLDEATEMLLREIRARLRYLVNVGLGYLTLDRQSRTLSGGEVQRINLTTALGTSLINALFVLDEPSIGLHSRDIRRLIDILHRLRDAGNTLIVVEHDPEVIRAADVILDMGPGPGEQGGKVVFFGSLEHLLHTPRSLTAQYLTGKKSVTGALKGYATVTEMTSEEKPEGSAKDQIAILGAAEHNLKDIDVYIPLGKLVCITGVSGSGKSTLVQDILFNALRKLKSQPVEPPGRHRAVRGHELVDSVVLVDQSPIGKTTRSNPASYVGAFGPIRKLFSCEPLAQERGYTPGTFSFNSGKGRCPTCGGNGFEHIEMQFLSDVYLRCPDCDGKRYRRDVLEVKILPSNKDGKQTGKKEYSGSAKLLDGTTVPGDAEQPGKRENQGNTNPGNTSTGDSDMITKSIADVLNMTVAEACDFFSDTPEVLRKLEPLLDVGLGYLALGQPVPTLSGGEAQRLKLAGHLAHTRSHKNNDEHILFLFDEPTTGLHFDDIATLLGALRKLIKAGHSIVVIEHNLDVIRAADWIIDLGPEGGDAGGGIVSEGTPDDVMKCKKSHTGKALSKYVFKGTGNLTPGTAPVVKSELAAHYESPKEKRIFIRHAREHNLKNIDVRIPLGTFAVITGVSGSGKSTLAFDILFSEGQRRYLESLNAYARQFVQPASRPDVDSVTSVPPTIAIEQRTSRGGRKSTVATMTEIYHFLRLLFTKLGTQYCPDCDIPIMPQTRDAILARILKEYRARRVSLLAPLVFARKGYYTDLAKWAAGKGFSHLRVDGELLPTDNWPRLDRFREHTIELPVGELVVRANSAVELKKLLDFSLEIGRGVVKVAEKPQENGSTFNWKDEAIFSTQRACPHCGRSFEELDPRSFSFNSKHGWCSHCYGTGLELYGFDDTQTGEEIWWNEWWEGPENACKVCGGLRLRPEALAVRFRKKNISDVTRLSVEAADHFFTRLKLKEREAQIARDIVVELKARLTFLKQVGLSYLSLDRAAPTLSGGEAQRIRLASQLGSNLRGVCYILDEPTIGLHARDNRVLLDTLHKLKAKGNTVVVVEHDEETIRQAEHVVDLGPGGGVNGGKLVYEGTVEELLGNRKSMTGRFLREPLRHPLILTKRIPEKSVGRKKDEDGHLEIMGARLHNLKNLRVKIPLGRLICVTGVSGSGKSTLVQNVLFENLHYLLGAKRTKRLGLSHKRLNGCSEIRSWESVQRALEVDQTPIGKTPRSCPATYVGFWDDVRRLFSRIPESMMRGYNASRFSFNVTGGRCEVCAGQGVKKIKMSFLPDVSVVCEACSGKRFAPETLAVHFKGKSIADVLDMSVDEAVGFFSFHPAIYHPLRLLQDVGLGYLTLGQQSPTLSGGEAQRIKLVTELAKTRWNNAGVEGAEGNVIYPINPGSKDNQFSKGIVKKNQRFGQRHFHTLYVLDEPTIGLHMADVEKLIRVLHRLVDAGNTVVIIEHNLDVIAEADWIIDLGPEGGDKGGRIVAQGTPQIVANTTNGSYTAEILAKFLKDRMSNLQV